MVVKSEYLLYPFSLHQNNGDTIRVRHALIRILFHKAKREAKVVFGCGQPMNQLCIQIIGTASGSERVGVTSAKQGHTFVEYVLGAKKPAL